MKVLFVSNFFYRFGPPITLFRIIRELKKQGGLDISVLSFLDGPVRKWYEEIGISPTIKNLYESTPMNIKELTTIIKKEKPDLIFVNTLDSINACFAANLCQKPCLLYVYEDWPQINASLPHFLAFNLSDLMVFTSRYQKSVYAPLLEDAQVAVVPEGVPLEEFNPQTIKKTKEQIKSSLGLPPDKKVVSIMGTVCPRKKQDLFVFAAHEILKQRDDMVFLIIGWYREEENYYQLLKKYIQAGGREEKIIFLGDRENVAELYHISDIIVCSSSNDVAPMVIREARAFGKPVIAAKIDGIVEAAEEAELIESGNQKQLENAILKLLEHPKITFNRKYPIQKTARSFSKLFKKTRFRKKSCSIKWQRGKIEFQVRDGKWRFENIVSAITRDFR